MSRRLALTFAWILSSVVAACSASDDMGGDAESGGAAGTPSGSGGRKTGGTEGQGGAGDGAHASGGDDSGEAGGDTGGGDAGAGVLGSGGFHQSTGGRDDGTGAKDTGGEDDPQGGMQVVTGGSPGDGGTGGSSLGGMTSECTSVRLTQYWSADRGWCEFSRSNPVLPDFVRAGMTLAIAQPYDGGSYGGPEGESCGECWEIDTVTSTEIVMVYDLCPIEGNPLCAGGHFHFDLSPEAAAALEGGSLDEARARRVPCPVSGNIHAEIVDRNEWGYLRLAFVNHRFPIRSAEYRAVDGDEWRVVERSGGAWHVNDEAAVFADGGPGGVFRFTSASGESVEGTAVLTQESGIGAMFDTGAHFAEEQPSGASCEFRTPGDVYDGGWGGIDEVRWASNSWGGASISEVTTGCAGDSASCLLVSDFGEWDGVHLYYRQAFPTDTFSRLALQVRTQFGKSEVTIAPEDDGVECSGVPIEVTSEWTQVEIDVADACSALDRLNGVVLTNSGDPTTLLIDEVAFE